MIQIKRSELKQLAQNKLGNDSTESQNKILVMISTSLAARTSYTLVGEEKGLNYENLISLHDRLLTQDPPHSSPMEHCARAMSEDEYGSFYKGSGYDSPFGKGNGWCYNLKGFIPYRYFVDNGLVI